MPTGPMEFFVVEFPDATFSGADEVLKGLAPLVKKDTVHIVDVVALAKDASGAVTLVELDEIDDLPALAEMDGEYGGFIGDEDVEFLGEDLDLSSSALVVLLEDVWAAPLAAAVERSGGSLTIGGRVPKDLADEAVVALATVC